ncbi:hypothetical protein C9426_17385 [Serratia sp. S1B]|nr:hypothetical protein C9426_17385 [Serratia sp. S1B]
MNSKLFKSVWNASLGNYVAVAENAKNHAGGQSVSIKTPIASITDRPMAIGRLSRLSQALLACFSLTLVGMSTASYAACTVTPGVSVSMDAAGICTAPDGSYAGSTYVFMATAGTIENSGDITLSSPANNTAEFVRAYGTGAQVLLNNLTVSPFTSSGGGTYGLHAGGTSGNIVVSGLYTFAGSGTVWGAAAGNLGSGGTITLNDVDINITGGNAGAGLITSTNASNVLTVNGSLLLRNAATNSQGINVANNATVNLHGSGAATNNITLSGSGSTGMLLGSNSTLDATNLVSVIGTTAANTRGLTVNGAGGKALLHGGLTATVASHAITAASGGQVTVSGLTTASTTENNAYGAYATGTNSAITLDDANITTSGVGSYGVYATSGGRVALTGSGTTNVSVSGDGISGTTNVPGNAGILANGGTITSAAGTTLNIAVTGKPASSGSIIPQLNGVGAFNNGSVELNGDTIINMTGISGEGLRSQSNSLLTVNGNLSVTTANGHALYADQSSSKIVLNGPLNIFDISGYQKEGLYIRSAGRLTINSPETRIMLHGGSGDALFIMGQADLHGNLVIDTFDSSSRGVWVQGVLTQDGTTTITTRGSGSTGINGNGSATFADVTITTSGADSHGVHAASGGSLNFNGTGTSTIKINGDPSNFVTSLNGLLAVSNGRITTAAGSVFDITMSGNANGINRTYGAHSMGAGAAITLNGTTNITTTGFNGFGVRGDTGGTIISNGNLNITTAQGSGVQSSDAGSVVTLAGAQNSINVSAQNGSITNGILVSNGAQLNINSANTTIETHGTNAYGIQLQSTSGANVNINGPVSIETLGPTSHGFYLIGGSTYTFDGAANHQMPTFVIHGLNSAVLDASGNGSLFTLTNDSALNMSMTPVAGTWGAKAEAAGRVLFTGSASTGGTGLWASGANSIIELAGAANSAGSRVLLDASGILNISAATQPIQVGSLEGSTGTTVNLGNNTLSIGNNNVSSDGSLINEATFAGSFTNAGNGALLKTGNTTQILSGQNNTVASVSVDGGMLSFQQAGAFNTSGNYTTANGGTTDIGKVASTLNVGGEFTQQSGSALSVTVGANPDIVANTAVLDGTLVIRGFDDGQQPAKASEVTTNNYTLIHTTNGISGDFTNNPLDPVDLDYLLHEGHISADGKDYNLGFQLAWTEGGQAQGTGNFTLSAGTAFDIDQALTDQTGPFDSGWDGKSLTKNGEGLLVLSAVQGYTGTTTLNGGTLQTDIADAFDTSTAVAVNGGVLDLNGNHQIAHNLSGTGGEVRLTNGAQLQVDNSIDTTYAGSITNSGNLIKVGSGMLTLTGDASHSGLTTVDAGTLSIGNGGTSGSISSDIVNNATLIFNRSDDNEYAGILSGEGVLYKQGAGDLILTGGVSSQGSVAVRGGTLTLGQGGSRVASSLITTGDYTTYSGVTTAIGMSSSTLNVGGTFTQQSGSILNVTLGASPDITAQRANLDGRLIVNGFVDSEDPTKASGVLGQDYVLMHTTDVIVGDFTNDPLEPTGMDYLLHSGHTINNDHDYALGFFLAWNEGEQQYSTGNFTLNEGTGFNVDIALDNQTVPAGGFTTGWDGQSLKKDGVGRLVLSAVNGYTGSTTVENGTLQLDVADSIKASSEVIVNGGIVNLNGNDQQFNRLSGNGGEVQLNGATLTAVNADTTANSDYAGAITGNGTLVKDGAGSLTLSGNTAWVGDTELQGGSLILDGTTGGAQLTSNVIGQSGTQLSLINGASLTGWIDPTHVDIDSRSQWTMTADSLVDNFTHAGTVTFVAPTANDFKTLTVNGNYVGNNGLLVMNTQLADDSSLTDKLVVAGNTSGTTRVQINNIGGTGAQTLEGIEVVRVGGESNGEFVQNGRIVAGAYDYTLGRGSDAGTSGNWYLTSKSQYKNDPDNQSNIRPEAGAYNANLAAANTMFVTRLHDRLGETQYIDALTGEHKVTSMWLRNEGGHNNVRDESGQLRTQSNRYVLQLGGDIAQWSNNGADRFHLGLMAGYGDNKSNTVSHLGYDAKGAVNGYSVGAYGTWYANQADKSGWYVDSWLQYSWFNNTVTGQEQASESYKSKGFTASVESGYTVKLGESVANNMAYFIQPKAQLTWMGVKADDHREVGGTWVKGEGDGNLQSRLGVKAFINGYSDQDKGKDRVFQPFVEANWVHNSKDFGSNLDGLSIKQDGAANIAELKLGVEGQLSKQVNLWGNVGQQVGNNGYSDTSVMLGAKYNF